MIRRDLLKFSAGATAGLAFTPFPWRLLGDSAIWTQNWSWMPRVPAGEITQRSARCTLCPAACAVNVRCSAATPTGLWPRESAMCPAGLVAHHLAWHPIRLKTVLHGGQPSNPGAALEAARAAAGRGATAVLDLLPGRAASLVHRMHLASLGGLYLTPPLVEGATAQAVSSLLSEPAPLAADLAGARTVLSLATPLLDGWAAPERTVQRKFRLIQAEPRRSRTAGLADEWLAIRPGSETALLLGLAHTILRRPTAPALKSLPSFAEFAAAAEAMTPAMAAERTGIEAGRIEALAQSLSEVGPALVIADGDPAGGPLGVETQAAAAAVNVLLGLQGFRRRPAMPAPAAWAKVAETPVSAAPDSSIALLLIDDPLPGRVIPWSLVAPKLRPNAVVIALAWSRASWGARAAWVVPSPAFLEAPHDSTPAHDDATARFAVSPAMLPAPEQAMHAADFVARLAGDTTAFTARLSERIQALGADEKELLENGGEWRSASGPAAPGALARILPAGVSQGALLASAARTAESLRVVAHGWRGAAVSPLLGKLWQESELRQSPRDAAAHPATLRNLNLAEGRPATIESPEGRLPVRIAADESLPEGTVALAAGPAYSQLCRVDASGSWRVPGPKVVPA